MNAQLYLITPPDVGPDFAHTLGQVLATTEVAAVLIQRGEREDDAYVDVANALIPIAQKAGAAALLDNMPEAVKRTNADGVHMTSAAKDIAKVVKDLKPNSIVGAGGIHSKHDAMTKGELNVDYVFFGHLPLGKTDDEFSAEELAIWWAETFEVPAVCFDQENTDLNTKFEFRALREQVWQSDQPAQTLAIIAKGNS
ncbi:thiamine phosphate synthase [Maritalea porphyrae]|uniref:Thiamine phosphate synthase n=1 Tax=Maritalea porphyrae TaxID=880732 RepID=A0ABQ5UMJ5_9HYPH|nr:thiamine phosphate synthase [Maritalea porphyrae]GLQ16261.1 thiamine phosphate synthase [Maritalea porphyrae]